MSDKEIRRVHITAHATEVAELCEKLRQMGYKPTVTKMWKKNTIRKEMHETASGHAVLQYFFDNQMVQRATAPEIGRWMEKYTRFAKGTSNGACHGLYKSGHLDRGVDDTGDRPVWCYSLSERGTLLAKQLFESS